MIECKGKALETSKTNEQSSSSMLPLLLENNESQLHTYGSSNGIQIMPEEIVIEAIPTCRINSTRDITHDEYEIVFEPKPNQELVSETTFNQRIPT